ncbi:MAG TPA: S9 family peptidase [Steroidobacteraceae bacterium]|jgi:acylaminoacyl-peptidase|nr:S9 family peptidase [Steroidobacteraceae bacterium]
MSPTHPLPEELFDLELPTAPAVSRSGHIAYLRHRGNREEDRVFGELWALKPDGGEHLRLAPSELDIRSFAWSPDGREMVYVAKSNPVDDTDAEFRLMRLELASGTALRICALPAEPRLSTWSPDGRWLAFVMPVRLPAPTRIRGLPPANRRWAPAAHYVDRRFYRSEGCGLIEHSDHLFVAEVATGGLWEAPGIELRGGGLLPATLAWRPDGSEILFASNLDANWQEHQGHSDMYAIEPRSSRLTRLTHGHVAACPAASPDGQWIAYISSEDRLRFHNQPHLRLMRSDGSEDRLLLDMDRDLFAPAWDPLSRGVYFSYFDAGVDKIGFVDLEGRSREALAHVGGTAGPNVNIFGTDYAVGSDFLVTTTSMPDRPPQIGIARDGELRALTALNPDWDERPHPRQVREIRYRSELDGEAIQGWIVYPPDFDPSRPHPLIVEIHGGPNAAYGPKFSFWFQCWAAAGFVVFYPNYRGSTSYGRAFMRILDEDGHPSREHEDILSGVRAVEALGGIDATRLYILGTSAGGTLTAWTIGHSQRFRAAVVLHPIINYTSLTLTWDLSSLYSRRWLPRTPWEDPAAAWAHSPLSRVGHVRTRTLVVVGDHDQRTPPGEGEQYYNALRQCGVESALLIRRGVGHARGRPSQEIELNQYILDWFT